MEDGKNDQIQCKLFACDEKEWWQEYWENMPEFDQPDNQPFKSILVHLRSREDMLDFMKLVGQEFTMKTKYVYWPMRARNINADLIYVQQGDTKRYNIDNIAADEMDNGFCEQDDTEDDEIIDFSDHVSQDEDEDDVPFDD